MSPRTFLPMRAVVLVALSVFALVAVGATSPMVASADALDDARARLSELRSELDLATDRYLAARDELIELNEMIDMRARQVAKRAKTLLRFQKDADELAVELYKGGSSVGAIEGMLSSETMADLNRATAYLEFSGRDQQRVIERVTRDTQELEHELDLLDEQREDAAAHLEEMENIRATVEANGEEVEQQIAVLEERAAADRAAELAAEREAAEVASQVATETIIQNPPPSTAPVPSPSSEADWDAIAMCESGGNWHIDSTYDGGLQFHPNTWLGYGGGRYARYAWQATREQQIAIAEKVLAGQGPGAWPNCFQWK